MLRISTQNINKNFKNICINCKHFVKDHLGYPDYKSDNGSFGKCSLFGTLDLITGDATYDYARHVREDSSRCGTSGRLFESI